MRRPRGHDIPPEFEVELNHARPDETFAIQGQLQLNSLRTSLNRWLRLRNISPIISEIARLNSTGQVQVHLSKLSMLFFETSALNLIHQPSLYIYYCAMLSGVSKSTHINLNQPPRCGSISDIVLLEQRIFGMSDLRHRNATRQYPFHHQRRNITLTKLKRLGVLMNIMSGHNVAKIFALMLIAAASGLPQKAGIMPAKQVKVTSAPVSTAHQAPLPPHPHNHYYSRANHNVPYPLSFRLTNGFGNALQATEFHLGSSPGFAMFPSAASAPLSLSSSIPHTPAAPAPLSLSSSLPHTPAASAPFAPIEPAPLVPVAPDPLSLTSSIPLTPAAPAPIAPIAPAPLAPIPPAPLVPIPPAPLAPIAPAPLAPIAPAPLAPIAPASPAPAFPKSHKANALGKSAPLSATAPMMVLNLQEFMSKQGTASGTSPNLPFIVIVPKDFALNNPSPKAAPAAARPQRSVPHDNIEFSAALQQILVAMSQAFSHHPQ
ncbi:BCL-6 corepressor-like protein 1 [Penaeus japonicus]|uniref:BCL-6 corepressor-like protein 1 n=1 Tax=Penaeus japonicus TaxID=27405 RepID=UPI001C70C730|nr:BCL-6 corepressor-like protein 1 [Penaeus japonicus]